MDAAALRAEFPVFAEIAYLNSGTCGPVPRASVRAVAQALEDAAALGRSLAYFEATARLAGQQREAYAALLDARPQDVALTTSTSEGIVRVLAGLDLRPGDEVVTAEGEHPGLLGPLAAARERFGIAVLAVPLARVHEAVGPRTRLVACSHVGWVSGERAPAELAALDVPVLLDGAQGIGAVPCRVRDLGCAFYAGPGQKWLCGPVGTGLLWVHPEWAERVAPIGPTYLNLADPASGLGAQPHPDARRHDASALGLEQLAAAAAAFVVLADAGWAEVQRRAATLAADLASRLGERGFRVAPRGDTTLVAWEVEEPVTVKRRLAGRGVVVRDLPGTPYVRASVGAWNDETDVERLLDGLEGAPARAG